MPENPTAKPSSKYKAFMFGGIVTLYIGPDRKKMEIHKKLLASISPELDKHVNNNMKEGIEGIINFPDEGEEAFTLFSEWAYTGSYTIVDDMLTLKPLDSIGESQGTAFGQSHGSTFGQSPGLFGGSSHKSVPVTLLVKADPWPSLRMHLQLYVFSHKFNIPTLTQLARSNFSKEIDPVELTRGTDAAGLVSVIEYAYDNLLDSDPVPIFLARYASWKLGFLRDKDEFIQLVSARPELMKELFMTLTGPPSKPALS
ncbi:hypothetical protein B9Z19DRAFT_1101068 [Tuber borchii]|uniref:BTB domain-containing protein n=1 Tax=Tuber borchii TaxID=42251 RepID=A0A2T6ZU07_TUBBO|nr:hypothetical protein B9Z19DRAFT_1101068 [Tuber borchii]